MVEMTETARILNTATPRSLVVLDEIGRGTSTYDGISLAWAIVEHLHDAVGCRTFFATHYHELTDLADSLAGVRNLNVAVREWEDQVVFLHKIVPGAADKSYGIHVARLAGVPKGVNERAKQILAQLEAEHLDADGRPKMATQRQAETQRRFAADALRSRRASPRRSSAATRRFEPHAARRFATARPMANRPLSRAGSEAEVNRRASQN